jgi:hypothetical protein
MTPVLRITDGITTNVDLLDLKGWLLRDWSPAVAEPKSGGIFRDSSLVDGRKLVYRKMGNVTDTFNLVASGDSQDSLISSIQELERILEKATTYWTTDWRDEPVYIEARATYETNSRYAVILDYRLTGFGGPYRQPFFDCHSATEAILVIEHGFWQETAPGAIGACAKIHNESDYPNVTKQYSVAFYPNAAASDGTYSTGESSVDLAQTYLAVGWHPSYQGLSEAGIVFDNITIAAGSTVVKAMLNLEQPVAVSYDDIYIKIMGQLYNATVFSGTNADYLARVRTIASLYYRLTLPPDPDAPVASIDITNVVQEIVANSNWNSGDDLGIFIALGYLDPDSTVNGKREIGSYEGVTTNPPELVIEWYTSSVIVGHEATCSLSTFVSNKHTTAPVNFIYCNDIGAGTFSPNLYVADYASPQALFQSNVGAPVNPGVGDFLYFGSCPGVAGDTNYGRFTSLAFDLSSIQLDVTGKWQFYNGGWTDFSSTLCGDQISLSKLGVGSVIWKLPVGWTTVAINGHTGYWVRYAVTAVGGTPTSPYQQDRSVYTVLFPYIDIDSAEVPGDIPALARLIFDSAACSSRSVNTLVAGLRTLSRGDDFTAYLNASPIQNPPNMAFINSAGHYGLFTPIEVNAESPTGYWLHMEGFNSLTVMTNACYWTISGDLAKQYIGTYHAYVRMNQWVGNPNIVKWRLSASYGTGYNTTYSDTVTAPNVAADEPILLDLGLLTIHPYNHIPTTGLNSITIHLDSCLTDDIYTTYYATIGIYGIILIPVDEWAGMFEVPSATGTGVLSYGTGLDIDSITNPRQYRVSQIDSSDVIISEWTRVASSEPIFQANTDQRLWFLQYRNLDSGGVVYGKLSYFENCGLIRAERSARYLLMRGSR